MRKYLILFLLILTTCLIASCASQPASDYNIVTTIKDIMDSQVEPSADYIWESFGTEVSAEGVVEKRPQNDDDWKEERRRAVLLIEAANLIMMPGRKVARPGEKSENPGVELDPTEIQELIDKDRPGFIKLAKEFQDTAIEQLKFVDEKNIPEMLRIGADLDMACENCHKKYWYPNDPGLPPEPAEAAPTDKGAETTSKK